MGTDQTVELSDAGYQFLIDFFHRHDKVCDLYLQAKVALKCSLLLTQHLIRLLLFLMRLQANAYINS